MATTQIATSTKLTLTISPMTRARHGHDGRWRQLARWTLGLAAAALLVLGGCGGGEDTGPLGPCPPNSQDQQSAGSFIFSGTCTGCHSSNLEGADRQGAPVGTDYDTPESIREDAEFIFSRVEDLTMPPPNGLNDMQIEAVRVYITCLGE